MCDSNSFTLEPQASSQAETATASELVACQLTPIGRGAVAVIGLRGDLQRVNSEFRPVNGIGLEFQKLDRICYGYWGSDPQEDVVAVRKSDSVVEIHCHGGMAAVDRILGDVQRLGGKIVEPQEWMPGSAIDVECLEALTRATTERTAHHLLEQASLLPELFNQLESQSIPERTPLIETMLSWSSFGRHFTTPWKVVLCGRPNVGKSSLINALVGYTRSVVYDMPGTTRDVVAVESAFDGWPVELSDTAGLRQIEGNLEAAGIAKAQLRISEADLVVVVLDATTGKLDDDQALIETLSSPIVVWNKCDLVPDVDHVGSVPGSHAVSAQNGTGIPGLIAEIVSRLVPRVPTQGTPVPITQRQIDRLLELLQSP
ncbi:GTPase [Planctomicrobium sp. SH668]|uniref:GTPase n=1 Tax=Planctomicrobium sp. SH668 TaxID=3448126 RepID=UPI003F5AFF2D